MTDADADGCRLDGYTISSSCEPNGSGELKLDANAAESVNEFVDRVDKSVLMSLIGITDAKQ